MIDPNEQKRLASEISNQIKVQSTATTTEANANKKATRSMASFLSPSSLDGALKAYSNFAQGAARESHKFIVDAVQDTMRLAGGAIQTLGGRRDPIVIPDDAPLGEQVLATSVFGKNEVPTLESYGRDFWKGFGVDDATSQKFALPTGLAFGLIEVTPLDEIFGGGRRLTQKVLRDLSTTAAATKDEGAIYRSLNESLQRLSHADRVAASKTLAAIDDPAAAEEYLTSLVRDTGATTYNYAPDVARSRLARLDTEAARIAGRADEEIAKEAALAYRQINSIRKIADEAGQGRAGLNELLSAAEEAYDNLARTIKATSELPDDAVKNAVRSTKLAPEKNPQAVQAGFDVLEDGRIAPKADDAIREAATVALKTSSIDGSESLTRLSDVANGRFPTPVEGEALLAELGATGDEIRDLIGKNPGSTVVRGMMADSPEEAAEKWLANVSRGTNPEFGNMDAIGLKTADGQTISGSGGNFFSEAEIQAAILDGKKERGFITSMKESPYTAPEVAAQVRSLYDPITNKETLAEATEILKRGEDEALSYVTNAKTPTATSNAVAQLLIESFQQQGKMNQAVDLVEMVAERATAQGQAIQALALWNRLTPAGVLRYAEKELKNHGKKLTPDLSTKLVDMAQAIKKMDAGYEKSFETAKMLKLISDEIPVGIRKKLSLVQTMMLLLNPKTWIRNLIGNAGFAGLEQVSDIAAASLDSAMSLVTGVRTTVSPSILAQSRGALTGAARGWKEAIEGVNTLAPATQFDIPQTQVFKNNELLGVPAALEKLLNIELRVPDRMFYQAAYDGSAYKQLKAYNLTAKRKGLPLLTEPTPEMVEVATHDALYRTFQDDSAIATGLVGLKRVLNGGKDFGLGDVLIKFPKTPGNLLSRGIDYSPAGFVNFIYQASKPLMGKKFDQKKFVEAFGRATTGTAGLVGTGLLLSQAGILTGMSDDPDDVKGSERANGLGDYKINVSALKRFALSGMDPEVAKPRKDDTLVTYDWFQPAAVPIAIGSNIGENGGVKGESFLGQVVDAVLKGADTLVEQPVLSNFSKFFEDTTYYGVFGALGRQLANLPATFVPTLFNQVRQLIDNDSRNTYSPDTLEYAMNLAKTRIPGLSQTLPRRYNAFGEKQEVYQGGTNNPLNVFFNPMFVNKYKDDPAINTVLEVYEETGDTEAVPDQKRYKQTVNGEETQLGPKTYAKFSKFVGEQTRHQLYGLSQDPAFNKLTDEEKAEHIAKVLRDVHAFSKIVVLGDRPERPSKRVKQMVNQYGTSRPAF